MNDIIENKKGICIKCINNYGFRNHIMKNSVNIFCLNCNQINFGIHKEIVIDILEEYFNDVSHRVGTYFKARKYFATERDEVFTNDLRVSKDFELDLKLIHDLFNIHIYHGSPRLFVYGIFNRMNIFEERFSDADCEEILNKSFKMKLNDGYDFFRIRKNPSSLNENEFDSAPIKPRSGRYDINNDVNTFYCSDDIDTCVYECRTLPGDDSIIAHYKTIKELNIVDFSKIKEDEDPHECVKMILHALMNTRYNHENLQILSKYIHKSGYDGIKYRSYYSQICDNDTYSYVLYGKPIYDNKIRLMSLNNVNIRRVKIEYDLGCSTM